MPLDAYLKPRGVLIGAGQPAPDFTLKDQSGQEWSLSGALAKGEAVLCFFPMAFTSVCGAEMTCINDELESWQGKGTQVVGISCDSPAALNAWAESLGLQQPLLSDMHREVCKAYGLYWKEMNIASRGTVIVGQDGLVRWSQSRAPGSAMDLDVVVQAMEA